MKEEQSEQPTRFYPVAVIKKREPGTWERLAKGEWAAIVREIATGSSLKAACERRGMERCDVHEWIFKNPGRMREYNDAYVAQGDSIADEITVLAQNLVSGGNRMSHAHVQAIKVAIDAYIWSAAIRNAKKYGNRSTLEIEAPVDPRSAREQLEQLRKELTPILRVVGGSET